MNSEKCSGDTSTAFILTMSGTKGICSAQVYRTKSMCFL